MFARALIACLLATVLAGCGGGPSLFGPSTGTVTGHVQIRACGGAFRPEQTTCPTHAYTGVTLTFTPTPTGAGSEKAVTTDSNGSYRIDLLSGTYTVRASGPGDQSGGLGGGPRQIIAVAGKTVTADFVYTIQLL